MKKIISLVLIFALSLNVFSPICNANYPNDVSAQIEELQQKLEELKQKKQAQQKEQQQQLQVEVKQYDPSIWEMIVGTIKGFLCFIGATAGAFCITAPFAILVSAASDCSKDKKCHFDNKSFWDKIKNNTNWKTAMIPVEFVLKHSKFILNNK